MAWSENRNNGRKQSQVTVTLRITEIELFGVEFTPTIRIGWLNNDFSVFAHWKKLKYEVDKEGNQHFRVGWKSALIKFVPRSAQTLSLVLFQRVGETESPVALRTIPCSQIVDIPKTKHKFTKLPLQNLQGPVRGHISGWIRCEEFVDETVQAASWFGKYSDTGSKISETVSNSTPATQDSVDMSIDLTLEIPTVYYPFIKESDVFRGILEKHITTLQQCPYLLQPFCNGMDALQKGITVDNDSESSRDLFLALGMVVSPRDNANHGKAVWHLPENCDLDSLQFAAQEVAAQLCD